MKLLPILIGVVIVFGSIAIEINLYDDCKKVGHSTFYCIWHMGK